MAGKWETIGEAHLSYYATACNRVETNQPPQDQFISIQQDAYMVTTAHVTESRRHASATSPQTRLCPPCWQSLTAASYSAKNLGFGN